MAYYTNPAIVNFGTLTGAADLTVSHGALIYNPGSSVAPGGGAIRAAGAPLVVWTGALAASRVYVTNDPIAMPLGAFDLNLVPGVVNDAAVLLAWQLLHARESGVGGVTNPGLYALLGTAAMGDDGTANEVAGRGYTRQLIAPTIALGTAPT